MKQGIYISPTGQIALIGDGNYVIDLWVINNARMNVFAGELKIILDGWHYVGEL